jgi:hypothetical protein
VRNGVHVVLFVIAILFACVVLIMATSALTEPEACPDGSVKTFNHAEWLCTVPPMERQR